MPKMREIEIEDNLGDNDAVVPFKYSITSYGADYPVDSLVRRVGDGSIYIPPFQRSYVWTLREASRFIESLLLGLPVPGIFLSKDQETQKMPVIDGQQRLLTLSYFYDGIFQKTGRVFALTGVQSKFNGITYKTLADEDRRRLDDSILHATIVKQDEPSDDNSSIYHIFERLNTSGTPLKPQEFRACIFNGDLNNLLSELNDNEAWRSIFGKVSNRLRDQELILRFFALYFNYEAYKRPMKKFLNQYMGSNRNLQLQSKEVLTFTFIPTIIIIGAVIGDKAFKPIRGLNAAVFDSVMVGIAKRLEKGKIENNETLINKYYELIDKEEYKELTKAKTADEDNVHKRIKMAINIFKEI